MPYTLRLATPATRDLVVEALKGAADQRTRVALGAARKVAEAKAAGTDVRSQAVKVTVLLAEAEALAELAGLEDAVVDPDGPDVVTNAIAEDEPADDEVAEVLR